MDDSTLSLASLRIDAPYDRLGYTQSDVIALAVAAAALADSEDAGFILEQAADGRLVELPEFGKLGGRVVAAEGHFGLTSGGPVAADSRAGAEGRPCGHRDMLWSSGYRG